jgi:hypothetical protein
MTRVLLAALLVVLACASTVSAQPEPAPAAQNPAQGAGRGGPGGGAAASGRALAPFDLTGYWVSLVTDDWRYRMLTPPKGNADYTPATAEARKLAEAWDPAKDEAAGEACRGYGAAGVMRLPGRLHITWENENTLRMDLDAGTQTRRFVFGASPPAAEPSWQGVSAARWIFPASNRGRGPAPTGQLIVTTTRMRPGYLRKNGLPYSAETVLTEYVVRIVDEAQEYLAISTMVDDPRFLAQPYVKTYQFKKQPDASGWDPAPCSAR